MDQAGSQTDYENIMQANRSILVEACMIMNAAQVEYVVVGGWVPYLRITDHVLQHPGTRDVDLLFNSDFDQVKDAVPIFFDAGYIPSAKHPFQLLKKLTVQGQEFVFNVDLMYPAEPTVDDDMFHDIIDLGVRVANHSSETQAIKSIAFLSADVIFQQSLWTNVDVEAVLPDGKNAKCAIPLMDERGLILSKCESIKGIKRGRDSFDIYFALSGASGVNVASAISELVQNVPGARTHIDSLKEFLTQQPTLFNERVAKYAKASPSTNYAAAVLEALR